MYKYNVKIYYFKTQSLPDDIHQYDTENIYKYSVTLNCINIVIFTQMLSNQNRCV